MNLALECIPCYIRHALEAARAAGCDETQCHQILNEALADAAALEMRQPPPALAMRLHRRVRELTGVADPYREVKLRFNQLALELLPEWRERVERSADPLETALRVSIAANVIDLGTNASITEAAIRESIECSLASPLHGNVEAFRRAVAAAPDILFLADNTGEIVFDKLLIERLQRPVTVAVRGGPVLNDATIEDALAAGLDEVATLMDNGAAAPGTLLAECSPAFRERFECASLIVSKGQGNFETLAGETGKAFFLLKIKCAVVAAQTGLPLGQQALLAPGDF